MKPVSIQWVPSAASTGIVWAWPPIRSLASQTTISCSGCNRCAATSPEIPVPTIAIFIAFLYGRGCRSGSAVGAVEDAVAEQLGDGGEAEAASAQGVDDLGEGGEGLAPRAAAVVHEDDRAVAGVPDDVRVDRLGPGKGPVLRVDVPGDRPHAEAAGGRDDAGVGGAAGRAEEAGLEVGVGADARGGAGDLRVAGVFDVVHRVVAELVAFGEDLPHRLFAPRHLLPDIEEGPVDALLAQDLEEVVGVVAGAVVE